MGPCVLLLVPTWPPAVGGVGLAARRLASGLQARGARVLAIVPEAGFPVEGWAPPAPGQGGSGAEALGVLGPGLSLAGGLPLWAWPEGEAAQAADLARLRAAWPAWRGDRLGLVHAVYPSRTGALGQRLAEALGLPLVVALRGNDLDRDAHHPTRGAELRAALGACRLALGVSKAHAAGAVALGAPRALAIPNGVAPERWRPRPRDPAWAEAMGLRPGDGPVVAFVGEARAKKGLATMLAAFTRVQDQAPRAALWLLGGLRPEGEAALKAWAAQHPQAAQRLRVLPWLGEEDLQGALAWADLAWQPSLADGLPNAALEALALGLPLLASPVGGLADLLAGSPLAPWAVRPGDAEGLAMATLRLWAAPELRARLGGQGRAWVQAHFSPDRELDACFAAYRSLA